jgi:maltose alpha-D-glucosyltransferase/alpha-amylase
MLLEKTLYELRYELEYRPSWAGIPLRGLRELIDVTPAADSRMASAADGRKGSR